MALLINETFAQKANALKKPLRHVTVTPKCFVEIENDTQCFQQLKAVRSADYLGAFALKAGESVILDFGDHYVGYLHYTLNHFGDIRIADSPVKLRFTFGEFPLEIIKKPEEYHGSLGSGWLQNEVRSSVFAPYTGTLERRYAFRYLKIDRIDSAVFPVSLSNIFADTVSAVSVDDANAFSISDPVMEKIYKMSLKTLKECEQDVFEDGPKRDRRLWIGDLRLQALADYFTFQNKDLVKRCIYLFAAYRTKDGVVAPCVFPDSPPCIDHGFVFIDYSLFFISCLYDYTLQYHDMEFLEELYPVALRQAQKALDYFDFRTGELTGEAAHIEWCKGLDKGMATACVLVYTLKQLSEITKLLGKDNSWVKAQIEKVSQSVLLNHSKENGLYKTHSGQVSWATQIWLVLADILPQAENREILEALQREKPGFGIHTPYLMHFYIDALCQCGMKEKALDAIKSFWGQLVDLGFDCCPEIFNPDDHLESPYLAPEINSACHAWSCTPIYWYHTLL